MTEHPIRLRNTASPSKEPQPFVPRDWRDPAVPADSRRVRMYVCGPTVYDRAHIGNARPVVVFDVLFRLLRHVYGPDHVAYVRNLTDVDDKINARAAETRAPGETTLDAVARITDETIRWYHEDMAALGALPPTHEPRATAHIPDMIAMIAALIEKGHAYAAQGHVLFSVASYPDYGRLARRSLDEMRAGARVEVAPYKRDPMDFVLWKPSSEDEPGWDSPWGRGRPGWHMECSAMSRALLGEVFDIHAGGIDLAFPHHENEVAQSCCANDTERMAEFWLHNGYLMVEGEKMSKSLGNFFTVKDLLDRGVPGEVIRMVLLMTHYRAPLDWTEDKVAEAEQTLRTLYRLAADVAPTEADPAVLEALADDLNTPAALARLHALRNRVARGEGEPGILRASASLLGLLERGSDGWQTAPQLDHATVEKIRALLSERQAARQARDFARADAIRDGLAAAGIAVKDTPQGSEWEAGADFDPANLENLEALQ